MSWLPSWLLGGVDPDEEQTRGEQLDAQLAELNQRQYEQGRYTEAEYQTILQNQQTGATGDVNASINSEFAAGAAEGLHNVLAVPGQIVGTGFSISGEALWGVIKRIPWWVWLAAAAALFVWMGGLKLLKGRLARA